MINKNGLLYKYVYNGMEKAYFCVTHHSEKADDTFSKSFDFFEKEVPLTESSIEDIYNINFYVYWDCGIEKVDAKWNVPVSKTWMVKRLNWSMKVICRGGILMKSICAQSMWISAR